MYRTEFRKAACFLPIWIYLGLCLLLNGVLIYSTGGREYFNSISKITAGAGQKINAAFISSVSAMAENDIRDIVLQTAENASPLYASYDVNDQLTSYYTELVHTSPAAVSMIERKYAAVQKRVNHLAEIEADMDFYAGPVTPLVQKNLFGTLLRFISAESCILGMLVSIYLFAYEKIAKTDQYFPSTKTGRRLTVCKIAVAFVSSIVLYITLTAVSLAIYFLHWDYSGIWNANMSSQFNPVTDLLLTKPFITTADFTVKGYLTATVCLSVVLVMIAVLFSSIIAILVQNHYLAGLITLLAPLLGLFVTTLLANLKMWPAYLYSLLQPADIWLAQPVWFTEGGFNAPCMWFEVRGLAFSFLLTAGLLYCFLQRSYRKDVL